MSDDEVKNQQEEKKEEEEEETKVEEEEEDEVNEKVEAKEEEVAEETKEEEEQEKIKKPKKKEVAPPEIQTPKKDVVPLYDQPLETSGKRDRKKVERFVQETKKEEIDISGTGTPLGEIPFIEAMITSTAPDDLKLLHRVAFSRPGTLPEIKKNLRKFNGFPFQEGEKKFINKTSYVERMVLPDLKKILLVLGLERGGHKGELVTRIVNFMVKPEDLGRKAPNKKKGNKRRGRPKKGQEKKKENSTNDGDESVSNDESKGTSDEDEEEEEKPKKTPAKKNTARKRPASSAKKAPAKKAKLALSSDDSSDSDDEPLAKKVKSPPSDAEIKGVVKKILDGADLEEVTMKSVCRQVYEKYPDFDLTHKKDFIKDTVKSIIS